MKVKNELIIFGACFVVGNLMFFGVVPGAMFRNPQSMFGLFGLSSALLAVGFFGCAGTFTYWLLVGRKKAD